MVAAKSLAFFCGSSTGYGTLLHYVRLGSIQIPRDRGARGRLERALRAKRTIMLRPSATNRFKR
jgi:hypothetical protein